ncbi:Beta-carotene isomerase D27, chloroplastic, partial [Linum perenne]
FFCALGISCLEQEVGWDSEKPGYDGLIEVANRLMLIGRSSSYTRDAAVRILVALFPPFLLDLFKLLISPLAGGQVAAVMNARVTQLSCQWLMGKCRVNSVDLPDGTSWESGVLVERCKYLEQSKCVGICINTCKLPTQTFFNDYMGVPLLMEPNFVDYSCQVSPSFIIIRLRCYLDLNDLEKS